MYRTTTPAILDDGLLAEHDGHDRAGSIENSALGQRIKLPQA
jgi:hypothetical protein